MNKSPKHIVVDGRARRAGVGRPADAFLKNISKIDNTNHYTVLVDPSDEIKFEGKNIDTVICRYPRFSMNPFDQIRFSLQIRKLKPDLVYFTLTGIAPLFYFGKNITFTHDLTMLRYARAGKLPEWLHKIRMLGYRLVFWKGNTFSKKIIVPSQFVKKDLAEYSPKLKDKIVVCYESGEIPVEGDAEKIKNKNLTGPYIFHLGSPFPHKNIHNLVLAFEQLKNDYPKLQLVLGGKKEYYFDQLEKWLEGREHTKDIIITGFLKDEELKWLYENASVYVLPCYSEGFGLPGLEAMAYGCPLASSNATCLPEIYGDAALYFDPDKPEEIAEKVKIIIESKDIKNSLVRKGKIQLKKYSWEKMTKEILDVINSV